VVTVKIAHPPERRRSPRLHLLVFRDQKSPLLNIVSLNRPVEAVVAHRIAPFKVDSISELVNMHNCALCSGYAQFVLTHDRTGICRLLAAQSALGRALYVHYGLDPYDFETNILIADGTAYFRSEASIRILGLLGPPWSLARALRMVPTSMRDFVYSFIARNRLRLFGKLETCYAPGLQFRDRVLDGG
jgi:predicted DCC family thiol-disulfide oxidoreductase YuxK